MARFLQNKPFLISKNNVYKSKYNVKQTVFCSIFAKTKI